MSKYFCIACNGLDEWLFGNPLTQCADFLNAHTPQGVHFNVIGGADPRPFIYQYEHNLSSACAAGYQAIIIGHSLGAMMMFYLADAMKKLGYRLPLVVSYDSTDWGTNAPGTTPYAMGSASAGYYFVPDNVDHWIHYRQPVYPGGGYAQLAPGNTSTKFENYERTEAHVWIPIIPDIEQHVLTAILAVPGVRGLEA
jgi:hypothetical protein